MSFVRSLDNGRQVIFFLVEQVKKERWYGLGVEEGWLPVFDDSRWWTQVHGYFSSRAGGASMTPRAESGSACWGRARASGKTETSWPAVGLADYVGGARQVHGNDVVVVDAQAAGTSQPVP